MVDKKERYERIYSFMKRNAHVATAEWRIDWIKYFMKEYGSYTQKDLDEAYDKLKSSKELQKKIADEVYNQMEQGIINDTTSGIWLSYNKGFERLSDLPDKSRQYIMTLVTGEKFLVQRDYISERNSSHTLKKRKIIKIIKDE